MARAKETIMELKDKGIFVLLAIAIVGVCATMIWTSSILAKSNQLKKDIGSEYVKYIDSKLDSMTLTLKEKDSLFVLKIQNLEYANVVLMKEIESKEVELLTKIKKLKNEKIPEYNYTDSTSISILRKLSN